MNTTKELSINDSLDRVFTEELLLQNVCQTPVFSNFQKAQLLLKRIFDVMFALFLTILLSPLFMIICLAIVLTSKGSPIYRQYRKGLNQKHFYIYKFRTMYENAHEHREKLFVNNESEGIIFKIKDDPRVTRVGWFLRSYSFDELPQILNVLKGDMSFIGPRPFSIEVFERKKISHPIYLLWLDNRHILKPGISGLWQVSGRNDLSFTDLVYYDLYYVTHWNLLLDLEILFKTLMVVATSKGAY